MTSQSFSILNDVLRGAAAVVIAGVFWLSGCSDADTGANLEKNVGDPEENSAAVANQPPPSVWEFQSPGAGQRKVVENPGVERAFADASGGHSLTAHPPNGYEASMEVKEEAGMKASAKTTGGAASANTKGSGSDREQISQLEQRVRTVIASMREDASAAGALGDLRIRIHDNEVTLLGTVGSAEVRDRLVEELRALPGLVRVQSQLQVTREAASE